MTIARAIILIAGLQFSGVASSSDWSKIYDGKFISIAIVGAFLDHREVVYIVEQDNNQLNAVTQDGKTYKSARMFWAVVCNLKVFKSFKFITYDKEFMKGNIVTKDMDLFLYDSYRSAEVGSGDEYMLEMVCNLPSSFY